MPLLKTVVIFALQVVAGQLIGFGATLGLGFGNGLELVTLPVGNALGVWGVGVLAERFGIIAAGTPLTRLVSTAVGSAAGALLLALLNAAFGFAGLLLPLIGALLGYYAPALRRG